MKMWEMQSVKFRLRENLQKKMTSSLQQKWWGRVGAGRGIEREKDRERERGFDKRNQKQINHF